MTRALDRGKVKDQGETLDSGNMAIMIVCPTGSTNEIVHMVKAANRITTVPGATAEEIQAAMKTGS
jgi:hypothetical protein